LTPHSCALTKNKPEEHEEIKLKTMSNMDLLVWMRVIHIHALTVHLNVQTTTEHLRRQIESTMMDTGAWARTFVVDMMRIHGIPIRAGLGRKMFIDERAVMTLA